jgi:hypothetical protein
MVSQFKDNNYNRNFFNYDLTEYQNYFNREKVFPILDSTLSLCSYYLENSDSFRNITPSLRLLKREFQTLGEREETAPFENLDLLNPTDFDDNVFESAYGYLTYLKFHIENSDAEIRSEKDNMLKILTDSLKTENLDQIIRSHHNSSIEKIVKGRYPDGYAKIQHDRIVKAGSPVYLFPESKTGRAAFFSSFKRFNNQYIETVLFNLSVVWILNFILYLILIGDGTRIIFNYFRRNKLEKT